MKQFNLNGKAREAFTKAAVKALRREECVPCVLYGNKMENLCFSVVEKELKGLLYTPNTYIVVLNIDGKEHLCILHDIQFHPVTDRPLHIDFLAIDETHPVAVNVPLTLTGHSIGVREGGKLVTSARKLKVKALVKDLPDNLEVDVTDLKIGKTINAGDLHYDNLEIISPKATIICLVKGTRASAGK